MKTNIVAMVCVALASVAGASEIPDYPFDFQNSVSVIYELTEKK